MSTATNVATLPKRNNLAAKFAERFSIDEAKVMDILKATAFKQRDGQPAATQEQMTALMIVADQYRLNPFTKEIYAYPDKQNGIVPVVSVDGWSRIMNEHPQLDGIEFRYSEETVKHKNKDCHVWIEAVITRKDRTKPIVVREYFDEVVRNVNFATPWDSHPKRMHRHKALIQGVRVAFGFAGIYDEDEAQRIMEKDVTSEGEVIERTPPQRTILPELSDMDFAKAKSKYYSKINKGEKTADELIIFLSAKYTLNEYQKEKIQEWAKVDTETGEINDDFVTQMNEAEHANA